MAKAIQRRETDRRPGTMCPVLIAQGAEVFEGTLVAWDAEKAGAVPSSDRQGLVSLGVSYRGGAAGAGDGQTLVYREGWFKFDSFHTFKPSDLLRRVYAMDDQTVGTIDDNSRGPFVGILMEIDPDGVWVDITPAVMEGRRN